MDRLERLDEVKKIICAGTSFSKYIMSGGNVNKIKDKPYVINYIKVINSSFLLFMYKDEVVNDNLENGKLHKEELIEIVKLVAMPKDDKWYIGDVKAKDIADTISIIRNKLAHGDFKINEDNHTIEFIYNNQKGYILINNLILFATELGSYFNASKKNGINKRALVNENFYNKNQIDHMRKATFFDTCLNNINIMELTDEPIFPAIRNIKDSHCIDNMINDIMHNSYSLSTVKKIFENNKQLLLKSGLQLNYKIISATSLDKKIIDKLKQMYDDFVISYPNLDNTIYLKFIIEWIKNILNNDTKSNVLYACSHNNEICCSLVNKLDSTLFDMPNSVPLVLNYQYQMALIYILSFYNVYVFALDDIYRNREYDHLEDIINHNKINFANLDLSSINPSINKIEHSSIEYMEELKQIANNYESSNKHYEDKFYSATKYYQKNINNINQQTLLKLENMRIKAHEDKCNKRDLLEKSKDFMDNDYDSYVKNREIIIHLRNAIAHGNFYIDIFNITNIGKNTLHFKDIYNGEVTFQLDISIYDFATIYDESNLKCLFTFINEEFDDELKQFKQKVLRSGNSVENS